VKLSFKTFAFWGFTSTSKPVFRDRTSRLSLIGLKGDLATPNKSFVVSASEPQSPAVSGVSLLCGCLYMLFGFAMLEILLSPVEPVQFQPVGLPIGQVNLANTNSGERPVVISNGSQHQCTDDPIPLLG
jgi:hypothetical protein